MVASKATWLDMTMQSFLNGLGMVYQGILVVDVDVGKCPMFFEGRQSDEICFFPSPAIMVHFIFVRHQR